MAVIDASFQIEGSLLCLSEVSNMTLISISISMSRLIESQCHLPSVFNCSTFSYDIVCFIIVTIPCPPSSIVLW